MSPPKTVLTGVTLIIAIICIEACNKDKTSQTQQVTYLNRVLQDSAYRLGKWVSINDSAVIPYGSVEDTIWFVSDSIAGYSGNGQPYQFGKYHFWLYGYIDFELPGIWYAATPQTIQEQCYTHGDTFQIVWGTNTADPRYENYVKVPQ
jgi:hypothetical protein